MFSTLVPRASLLPRPPLSGLPPPRPTLTHESAPKRRRTELPAMGSSGLEMFDLDVEDGGDSLPDGWETGQDRSVVLDPAEIAWEVAPARKGGPGRKVYRTGSASAVGSLAN